MSDPASSDTSNRAARAAVLVVEDDLEINELVGAYVEIAGYAYRAAFSGEDALRQMSAARPALVVLDMMLPDMDGAEVCRRMRAFDGAAAPVVILSALDRAELIRRNACCQAAQIMTKPFDPEQFMAALRAHARPAPQG